MLGHIALTDIEESALPDQISGARLPLRKAA